jgi:hypothetical protein
VPVLREELGDRDLALLGGERVSGLARGAPRAEEERREEERRPRTRRPSARPRPSGRGGSSAARGLLGPPGRPARRFRAGCRTDSDSSSALLPRRRGGTVRSGRPSVRVCSFRHSGLAPPAERDPAHPRGLRLAGHVCIRPGGGRLCASRDLPFGRGSWVGPLAEVLPARLAPRRRSCLGIPARLLAIRPAGISRGRDAWATGASNRGSTGPDSDAGIQGPALHVRGLLDEGNTRGPPLRRAGVGGSEEGNG